MADIRSSLQQVESNIAAACARSGRSRSEIGLIAVTKYAALKTTEKVLDLGLQHIGENRWQDAKPKWEAYGERGVWHFIGHLQTNKVRDVLGKFEYIHSLDRPSLAAEINKRARRLDIKAKCFIQLNVSGEATKFGLPPEQLDEFADRLAEMPEIEIQGLMTMAPHTDNKDEIRTVFRRLRECRDELNASLKLGYPVPHLSMGMSNDYEIAVEEGATWLRLGSVLVGRD